jgi:hypothetical protein
MITQKLHIHTSNRLIQSSNSSLKHQVNNKEKIIIPSINKTPSEREESTDQLDLQTKENDKIIIENQTTTLDLLDKIRQSTNAEPIGPMPLSLQVCINPIKKNRFYLYLSSGLSI